MTSRRRHAPRISNRWAGGLAALAILAVCWIVFGGPVPWSGGAYRLKAVFTVQTQLHLASPVRIAGVNVGKVTAIRRVGGDSPAAVVTMTIDQAGLPIHTDATAEIRPRLFLEGNFYVNLQPGMPSAPVLGSGGTLPAGHTSGPVQLDRVLSALAADSRSNLQTVLQGLGSALNRPGAGSRTTAAQSLHRSLQDSAAAFRASAIVNQALLGERPHDLSTMVSGLSHTFTGLAASGGHLASLVTAFDTTMGALAARQTDLERTIALLPATLRATDAALAPLDASFGPTRTFAAAVLPGIRQLGPTIDVALPWLAQSTALFSDHDLGGLLRDLTPAVQDTSATLQTTRTLLTGARQLAACFNHTLTPTANERISDPPLTTGLRVYQELFQSAVGIASASQDYDGNGRYIRASAGGGSDTVSTGALGSEGPLYANAVKTPLGTRPAFDPVAPPFNRSVQCLRENPPDLNAASTGTGP